MTDAILERVLEPPLTAGELLAHAERSEGCFKLHRVDWQHSLLSTDGCRIACWFRAADMESVRTALRSEGTDMRVLWSGTIHDAPDANESEIKRANVIVERRFDATVSVEDIQAIEEAGARCLEMRNVRFLRTFFSNDRKRMLCLYAAPDAESVRQAQREAQVPFETVWAFEAIRPESPAGAA